MTDDLRPAPRLPLDTAEYVAIKEDVLDSFIAFEPGEPVYQVSLLNTRTLNHWPAAWDREVYEKGLSAVYGDQQSAEDVVRPVLREFLKTDPSPPQTKIGKTLT